MTITKPMGVTAVNWSGDLTAISTADLSDRIDALARAIADNVLRRGDRVKTLAGLNEYGGVDKYRAACDERYRRIIDGTL